MYCSRLFWLSMFPLRNQQLLWLLNMTCIFPFATFNILSLFYTLSLLTIIFHGDILFCLVSCVLLVSAWICFSLVWETFLVILLKTWSMLLIWDPSPSSIAIIWRFGLFSVPYFLHVAFMCIFLNFLILCLFHLNLLFSLWILMFFLWLDSFKLHSLPLSLLVGLLDFSII